MSIEDLAKSLHDARLNRKAVEIPSELWPTGEEMVVGAQEEVFRLGGLTPGGWKAGPPPMGLKGEIGAARLPAEWTTASPARIAAPGDPFYVEAEFVVRIGRDLPADFAPYDRASVADAVDAIAPGVEVVWRRVAELVMKRTGILHMADSGGHMGFVLGEWQEDWRALDLSRHPVRLLINGKEIKTGHSGLTMNGHPFNVLAGLANREVRLGRFLKAGTWVTTGSCTGLEIVEPGDEIVAEYGELGKVELTIEGESEGKSE